MFKVEITSGAKKELKRISRLHKQAIALAIEEIRDDPTIGKPLTRELTGRYSYRVGVYRIIYKINSEDKIVYILTAGHRAKVYGN